MTKEVDYAERAERKRAAEELLQGRYGDPDGSRMVGRAAVAAVGLAVSGYTPYGREPREVPREDVLAALAQVAEMREQADRAELRLIHAARERGASWQAVADALGLGTRQSAETRALRLERAVQAHHLGSRDVASQRLDKARDRAEAAWCAAHADRIREVSERLYDTAGAWDLPRGRNGVRGALHAIGELLATDGSPAALVNRLRTVRLDLAPYGGDGPEPAGKHAPAAAEAMAAVVDLLDGRDAVRQSVTAARGEKP
ncbi:hypothetical protein OG599_35005 (plasmid) [Streptomyces sp. NBC_01335]|uniref:hypothetical protein n=1 Tax=Streptomyces sp. NBC_01335 TaxID=2903828 RepID=UPI002E12BD43|nr:hypothetical protein OG599_35005 [Streptomyces sp. NBC_01335]